MAQLPEIITHHDDPRRGLCQNLCNGPGADAEGILAEQRASLRASGQPGRLKENYLERRTRVEAWLLAGRTRQLGKPAREHPIDFVLGHMADGRDPIRPRSLQVPLAAFARDMVTFTYPDSMTSFEIAAQAPDGAQRRDDHGQIFTLDEIREVVAAHGLPDARGPIGASGTPDRFIEVQVWDERPIRRFLAAGSR
jgi:hypothetical protein